MRPAPRAPSRLVLVLLGALGLLHASRYTGAFTDAGFLALLRPGSFAAFQTGDGGIAWTMQLQTLQLLGVPGIDAARLLGSIGLVLCVAFGVRETPWTAGWVVASGGLAASVMTGSSLPLVAAASLAAARQLEDERGLWLAALLPLLRLDGIVLVLGLGAGAMSPAFVGVGLIAFLVHLGFAGAGFVAAVPVMGAWSAALTALLWHVPLLAVVAAAQVRRYEPSPALAGGVAWLLWILVAGLDEPGLVVWAPLVPLFALATERVPWQLHLLAGVFGLQLLSPMMRDVADRTEPMATRPVASALQRGFTDHEPTLWAEAPGTLPYLTGFASVPLHDADLVAFCGGLGAREACTEPGRTWQPGSAYRPVALEADGRVGRYWLRVDGDFGPRPAGEGLEIPALVLSTDERPAKAGHDGFYLDVPKGETVTIELELPRGSWRPATQGFQGPTLLHSGGPLRLTMTASEDRVASSLTWISEAR